MKNYFIINIVFNTSVGASISGFEINHLQLINKEDVAPDRMFCIDVPFKGLSGFFKLEGKRNCMIRLLRFGVDYK